MPAERSMHDVLRNLLQYGPLSFRDFVEIALYHPDFGYYARPESPVGKGGDYVTAPTLSPVFSYAIGNLVREFMSRSEAEVSTIVDIGAGDGGLIEAVAQSPGLPVARFFGIDRSLGRATAQPRNRATFVRTIDEVPTDGAHLIITNELYDAFPFARLVQRGEHLHELWITEDLDWTEQEAPPQYADYFASHGLTLEDGQFADLSLEWEAFYEDVVRRFERALIVTIDYGYPANKLFHPRARRFGTAAAYSQQRVTRDLLANPGEQDLTAHINFTDLERAGERNGAKTLFFDRLAKFLLTLDITSHELLQPVEAVSRSPVHPVSRSPGLPVTGQPGDRATGQPGNRATQQPSNPATQQLQAWQLREDARRLILPDGIGEDLRVLVQGKGVPLEGWAFQKKLF